MKIKITKKYLVFPVNTLAVKKQLKITADERNPYILNIKLDNTAPNFYAFVDTSKFIGCDAEIEVTPEIEIHFREADEINTENLYREPMRPMIHFSAKSGWINDPNGLVYLNGVYHMFYQYNPTEPHWDNMHWGHAESRDLLHWEEKDTALFPDERGMMFSGSAVVDEKNILGFNTKTEQTGVLFYTTTEPYCQHISYSTDGFKTLHRLGDEPAVACIADGNRDPKVAFCDELDCYIMALYLEKDIYCILKSENLTDWTELQRVQLPGDDECPDIFKINLKNGGHKWVLMGAHDKYLVGSFADGKFSPEQPVLSFHYGTSAYAGQSFSNLPNGRVVRVEWDKWNTAASNFSGQMGIPMDLSLENCGGTYYLQAAPISEIDSLCENTVSYRDVNIDAEHDFFEKTEYGAYMLKIKADLPKEKSAEAEIFGRKIIFDFENNEIKVGGAVSPITLGGGELDITVIIDRCSVELYADGGKIFLSRLSDDTVFDRNLPYFNISSKAPILINEITLKKLKSVWR